ncbi:LOW QUALITY PROTEIN: hypothetical protein M8C21_029484 [Ambrosia artemisiifolia]|uniref:Gamma-tubulin complex component n=1 Tax=Ambrosia artemisiifolia TaxID=4212 RepID=A0AAD5DE94_AMBAR|nr:LOW QUALITY PROTEIN: hypothetical protein M8C21_029484 [Ambrosia artemisiifolia]
MLHELLLALLGYTGDLIIDERERQHSVGMTSDDSISDHCTFKLAPDISFIAQEERDIIENIIKLGFYYRELDRFATKSRNLSWIRSRNESPLAHTSELLKDTVGNQSVYRRAIANGIIEILSIYRSAVLHIEQKLMAETLPILATVTQGLNKFLLFFQPLYALILEIERDGIYGGKLLNLLYKRCHCGVPELQTCIKRLLWHGHQVMYNQLTCWMVYGILHDQYGEFFISREQKRNSEHESSHSDNIQKMGHVSNSDQSLSDWYTGFSISMEMLPEYIPVCVAESILFAGKAIRVLRNPSSSFRFVDVLTHQGTGPQTFIESLRKEPSLNTTLTGDELLPQSEADKIESRLKTLQESSEFHKRSFEEAIGSIRTIAASHLWQLVAVRADLNGHLKAIKDYFLLAKGDFFQCFLEESRGLMRLPPRQSTAEADLMVPFQMFHTGVNIRSNQVDLQSKASGDGGLRAFSDTSLDGWDGACLGTGFWMVLWCGCFCVVKSGGFGTTTREKGAEVGTTAGPVLETSGGGGGSGEEVGCGEAATGFGCGVENTLS